MSYKEKIYVAYDGANDLENYKQMKSWQQSDGSSFNLIDGYEIYQEIDKTDDDVLKQRLYNKINQTNVLVLIIGKTTKSFRKFIRWQLEYAINNHIPIIAINVNGIRSVDYDRCPTILKKNLSVHITFQAPILEYALDNWPQNHNKHLLEEDNHTYRYPQEIYDALQLQTTDL